MRKYFQISFFLGLFGLLVFVRQSLGFGDSHRVIGPVATPLSPVNPSSNPQATPVPSQAPSSSGSTAATPSPVPVGPQMMQKRMGQYKDGTYTGSVQDAFYGNIQVQAVVSGGRITAVNFLQYPNDNGTSQYINSQADPMLAQEAIQAQNANVDIISGASDSSMAFQASLTDALSQAK